MSSTQHQLIEQCATRLRGIVEALDNIHDNTPRRWSTELDDVHSSAESLLALIKDQAPLDRKPASKSGWPTNSRARTASLFQLRYATLPSPVEHSTIGPSWNSQPRSVASASALACRRGW